MKRAGVECPGSSKMKKSNSFENQNFINYVFDPPTLKSIALVAVAVKIYGYPDEDPDYDSDSEEDYQVGGEQAASRKLEEISLPQSLKGQISDLFRPIELQWKGWVEYADGEDYGKYCDLKKLYEERGSSYWTMEGIVDVVKLLKDVFDEVKETNERKVDFPTLYSSACMYCMEEYIAEFWPKMPKKKKQAKYYARTRYYHLHAVAYWTASMNKELPDLFDELSENDRDYLYDMDLSICANMISAFIVSGNLIALKYFWNHKLTEEEKDSNIKEWIHLVIETLKKECFESYDENFDLCYDDDEDTDQHGAFYPMLGDFFNSSDGGYFTYQDYNAHTYIMCFLLSHLNSQSEQREVFQAHPKVILLALYSHWPLQRFFIPTITAMMDFLEENIYVGMMSKIARAILSRHTEVLLEEVWSISPLNLKKAFICYLKYHAKAIGQLLFAGDGATIDLILNYATAEEKRQIIFRLLKEAEFRMFLQSHSNSDKMAISAIDRLVSKTLSESDLRIFKENVMSRHAADLSSGWILSGDFESLNKLWNWASQSVEEIHLFKNDYIALKDLYGSLLVSGDYGYANDILNWYFDSEEKVSEFKKSFVHKDNLEACRSLMRHFSQKGRDGWELFEKFQDFSCNSSEEIIQIKKAFAEFVEQDESFAGFSEEFNSLFKKWCLSSDDLLASKEKYKEQV